MARLGWPEALRVFLRLRLSFCARLSFFCSSMARTWAGYFLIHFANSFSYRACRGPRHGQLQSRNWNRKRPGTVSSLISGCSRGGSTGRVEAAGR